MVEAVMAVERIMAKLAADLSLQVATTVATAAPAAAAIADVAATLSTLVAALSTLVATASASTIRVADGDVGRRVDRANGGLLLEAELGAEEKRIEAAEADGVVTCCDGRNQRLELGT